MNFKYWILRHIFKYTSPIISLFEKTQNKRYSKVKTSISPVFIVGAPRTGSTLLYQLLTQYFNTSYFDNLIHLARENVLFGFWLSNKIFKCRPHNSFKSKHGNTLKEGLHAPSEAGQIWLRWLPKHDNYFNIKDVSNENIEFIRNNISYVLNKFNKPLVIKNNYNGLRIPLLKEINSNSKIIFIKRDPFFTAQSIIKAREDIYSDRNKWWSVKHFYLG